MDLNIKNKKAFVSGGASGIGRAIVKDLSKEGVKVAFSSRKKSEIDNVMSDIGGQDAGHYSICTDITDSNGPANIAREIKQQFGDPDIVINNVGDTLGITDPFCPISDWRKIFRLNLEVHIELNNAFIPAMRQKKWGRIVNITAGAALENSGPVPYCTMKAAHTAYTRSMGRVLALEKTGIVMSAVLPGVVLTEKGHWQEVLKKRPSHADRYLEERTVLQRFGTPEEISPMVLLLCSELGSFCVGSIIPVEGGQARHFFATSSVT